MPDERGGDPNEQQGVSETKIGKVIRKYDLGGLGEELERRWLGLEGERQSLRSLADYFNRRVLEAALKQVGEQPIDGEIENHYRLLADDEVSLSARTQAETRLERLEIDVDSLRQDFVSHQTIHTYLTEVRETSLPDDSPSDEDELQHQRDTLLRLRNRLIAVTEQSLESLRTAGYLSLGSFDVMVSVNVYCNDCDGSYGLTELFRQQGCDCAK